MQGIHGGGPFPRLITLPPPAGKQRPNRPHLGTHAIDRADVADHQSAQTADDHGREQQEGGPRRVGIGSPPNPPEDPRVDDENPELRVRDGHVLAQRAQLPGEGDGEKIRQPNREEPGGTVHVGLKTMWSIFDLKMGVSR